MSRHVYVYKYLSGILVSPASRVQLGRYLLYHGNVVKSVHDLLYHILFSPFRLTISGDFVQFIEGEIGLRLSLISDDFSEPNKMFFRFLTEVNGSSFFKSRDQTPSSQVVWTGFLGDRFLSKHFPRRALAFALVDDLVRTCQQSRVFFPRFLILLAIRRLWRISTRHSAFLVFLYVYVSEQPVTRWHMSSLPDSPLPLQWDANEGETNAEDRWGSLSDVDDPRATSDTQRFIRGLGTSRIREYAVEYQSSSSDDD